MSGNYDSSLIDPYYTSGSFLKSSSGWLDAKFKVSELVHILKIYAARFDLSLKRVADVGCGTGDTSLLMASMLTDFAYQCEIHGYDIHPDIEKKEKTDSVSFYRKDFCSLDPGNPYDLVVLFDVIEHVPDPITFLKSISSRTKLICLHIPLDDSLLGWIRGQPRRNLDHPGHLIVLNVATSLNLLAFAGLRVQDFTITPVFRAPSGKSTRLQKLLNPLRSVLYYMSPYLLQRTLGGVSLMVIAQTPIGFSNKSNATT